MSLETIAQSVTDFVREHHAWAPFIVAALAFAESLAVVSFFVPAWAMLVAIGGLIGVSGLPFWPVWLGAALGAIAGDWLSYWVGHHFKDGIDHTWPLSRYPEFVKRAEEFTIKWGVWGVFLGRFSGPLRAFVPLAAGVFALPQWQFQIANVASALIWAFILLAPGDILGRFFG